jgi:hypothetical protein
MPILTKTGKKKMADILQTLELEFWCALIYPILV